MRPIRPDISKGATYPLEFRKEAVHYWLSSGQTLCAVASDLGLYRRLLLQRRLLKSAKSVKSWKLPAAAFMRIGTKINAYAAGKIVS